MATPIPTNLYSPSAGTPSQVNAGRGTILDQSAGGAGGGGFGPYAHNNFNASGAYIGPKVIYPTGYSASKYYDANGKYIGPPAGTILSVNAPSGGGLAYQPHTDAARSALVGTSLNGKNLMYTSGSGSSGINALMQKLGLSGNLTGVVNFNDKQTLQNMQERLSFNDQLVGLLGLQKKYTSIDDSSPFVTAYRKALKI